jgi:replication initiation protein RepC
MSGKSMIEHLSTTPFGRRQVSLGQIASQMRVGQAIESAGKAGSNAPAAVNKWALFRTLTQVKARLGVSDRALSVLNALLSFQQETALSLPAPRARAGQGRARGDADAAAAGQANAETEAETADSGSSCELVVFPSNRSLCLRAHGMAEATLRRHLAALARTPRDASASPTPLALI